MLSYDQVKELIKLTSDRDLGLVEIESDGFRIRIARDAVAGSTSGPATAPEAPRPMPSSAPDSSEAPAASPPATPVATHHILTSPIVGTFYTAPSPDSPPFVQVGERVSRGQVVCIVEAMKLMNEIEADADGVIVEVYPENAEPVEFGAPLFAIDTGDE